MAKDFIKEFHREEEIGDDVEMVLFIVSTKVSKMLYDVAKNFYQNMSICTQFYDSFREDKDLGNLSKLSNIVGQMNVKMGGKLH